MAILDFLSYMRMKFSQFSPTQTKEGSVTDELAMKPTAALLYDVYGRQSDVVAGMDVSKRVSWSETQMDEYGRRFFLERISGARSSGWCRIEVPGRINIRIPSSATLSSRSGCQYQVSEPVIAMGHGLSWDPIRSVYYVDFPIVAKTYGSGANQDRGEIVRLDGVGFQYSSVANPERILGGGNRETNDEYWNRIEYAMSVRSLVSQRGAMSKMSQLFPFVKSVYVSGSGDEYMTRDVVEQVSASTVDKKSFLGKTGSSGIVQHQAFKFVFPPEASMSSMIEYGPSAPVTNSKRPNSIMPSFVNGSDPVGHGIDFSNEFSDAQYSGLYFNDASGSATISTSPVFKMSAVPSCDSLAPWPGINLGMHGKESFGIMSDSARISVSGGDITFTGSTEDRMVFSRDIFRNTNLCVRFGFGMDLLPGSELNVMLASNAVDPMSNSVNAFSGVGFGITKTYGEDSTLKWTAYLTVNSGRNDDQIMMRTSDIIGGVIGDVGMIYAIDSKTLGTDAMPENTRYDVVMSLGRDGMFWAKVYNHETGCLVTTLNAPLPVTAMLKEGFMNKGDTSFGTSLTVSARTGGSTPTSVYDLGVTDFTQRRACSIFLIETKWMQSPVNLNMWASGDGMIGGQSVVGHLVHIWDKEAPTSYGGGWEPVDKLSDDTGNGDGLIKGSVATIYNIERHMSPFGSGTQIAVMVESVGTSYDDQSYGGDDVAATIDINYVEISQEHDTNIHLENCMDVYVDTYSNAKQTPIYQDRITALQGVAWLDPEESAMIVVSVTSDTSGQEMRQQATVIDCPTPNSPYRKKIIAPGASGLITVKYIPNYGVSQIQAYYDKPEYKSITGSVKVLHKNYVNLDIAFICSGKSSEQYIESWIKSYVDRCGQQFSIDKMAAEIILAGVCSSVSEKSEVSYYDSELKKQKTGTTASIRVIDFFRISSLQVTRQ